MVAFDNLRLAGFKSFVEATDMRIMPGLTGIVGPNGCGKSNLVEALRWVMGESSAKRLRGGEMDDVIFAGAAGRPARNQAEVTLRLANPDLDAPLQFNDATVLEVTRKVVRGQGSAYRVNGRDHRASDLKLLFADLASGASSNAMVAQGRVAAIVNARPQDRRALLEEAAGITGLYSRRRDAENRLRAAEANLERVDDLKQSKESQRKTLERQAAAATRYRDLQNKRRTLEAAIAYREWQRVENDLAKSNAALAEAESACEELLVKESAAQRAEEAASERLEPLRLSHGEAAATLQRLNLALEALGQEERGLEAKKLDLTKRLEQCSDDLAREQEGVLAAEERLKLLAEEETGLKAKRLEAKPKVAALEKGLLESETAERTAADALRHVSLSLSTARNERSTLKTRIDTLTSRQSTLQAALEKLQPAGAFEGPDEGAIAHLILEQDKAQADLAEALAQRESFIEKIQDAQAAHEQSQNLAETAKKHLRQAQAEHEGLAAMLRRDTPTAQGTRLAETLRVEAGLGPQVAAAIADGLDALIDTQDGDHWRPRTLPTAPDLPDGARSMAGAATRPEWLPGLLAFVGEVSTSAQAQELQASLKPGQSLTTPQGGLWRWDGFVAGQDRGAQSAAWIERQQRLEVLTERLPSLEAENSKTEQGAARAESNLRAAREAQRQFEGDLDTQRRTLDTQGQTIARAQRALAEQRAKIAEQEAERAGTMRELETVDEELRALIKALEYMGSLEDLEAKLSFTQGDHERAQAQVRQGRGNVEDAKRELISYDARLGAILTENFTFEGQFKNASGQLEVLKNRAQALREEGAALADQPAAIAQKRSDLSASQTAAITQQATAGDALAAADTKLRDLRAANRQAQNAHSTARESRARLAAEQAAAQERVGDMARQAYEKFKRPAADLLELAEVDNEADLPNRNDAEQTLRRIERQIDQIGPVNLAADGQVEELRTQLEDMTNEVSELTKAIAKLRKVIGELNQEGRTRLKAAFDQVSSHFGTLFQRLFGGGKARLELVGSDDPLEAGLEIFASPPGKRLQSLTLLSGGEQTLTALALIFAMFRANPAPLCVLDEVDAPLDDANVERMCLMLEDMAADVGTRFLVVTHNALTMARVDRLFGVTMAERGVSRLVSVDLEDAVQFQAA